ncbi:hypothetical protein SOVF_118210 [Spinacia oleracea]|nr:hypothetical protein SOVF_118210 [Spinacia oleracea]
MSANKMEEEEQSKMLPEEMIVEVLLRLPAKSVGRFRCVSNRWSCLLTEPQFIKSHLNRIKQHPTTEEPIFFCSPDSGIFYSTQLNNAIAHHLFDEMTCFAARLTFDDHRFYSSHRPDGSCDGLILMKNDHLNKLFLINPITREVKELPSLSYAPESHVSCNTYGLGHDSINDDYKNTVRMVALEGYLCGFADIFESLDAWMMKEYGFHEWTKMFLTRVSDPMYRPICLQIVLAMRDENTKEKLTIYNSEDGTLKDIVVDGIPGKFVVGGSFIETLVSPHCNNGVV